jgi:hypothetical protein
MTATFVIFGNVGNVTVVLRPSSDIKMAEDSTGDEISASLLIAHGEQHSHRGAGFCGRSCRQDHWRRQIL